MMPKMKTSKTAAKRFKKTGKGRLVVPAPVLIAPGTDVYHLHLRVCGQHVGQVVVRLDAKLLGRLVGTLLDNVTNQRISLTGSLMKSCRICHRKSTNKRSYPIGIAEGEGRMLHELAYG